MKYFKLLLFALGLWLFGCESRPVYKTTTTVNFKSVDGLSVTADLYPSTRMSDPIILMFHQSATSRGEYKTIAPRLQKRGFNCLAVDLRWGKKDFWNGVVNETAKEYGSDKVIDRFENSEEFQYQEVWPRMFDSYQDMKAAVLWARKQGFSGDLIIWGSSFSAMLQFKLGHELGDDIAAMVSFSPGEYYGQDTTMLKFWSTEMEMPVFLSAGKDTSEYLMVNDVFKVLKNEQSVFHQSHTGRHGSSILMQDEESWSPLISFLNRFKDYDAENYLTMAKETAAWLDSSKVSIQGSETWPDDAEIPDKASLSLSDGVSGKLVFYLELYETTKESSYLNEAKNAADYLLQNLPHKDDSLRKAFWPFSAYGNVVGSGYALTEMYKATKDVKYRLGALEIVDVLDHFALNKSDTISWDLGNDVLSGLSGTGLFLLYAAENLKSDRALEMAISSGKTIIQRAIQEGGGFTWKRGQNGNFILPNFSHGPAGIGYFLARLYEQTDDYLFLRAAQKSVTYLDSIAYTEDGAYLIPYGFPDPGWSRTFDIGWAHGPAGVARLFYQMYKIDHDDKWLGKMESCFKGIQMSGAMHKVGPQFGSRPFSIDQRFGLAGVGVFAFDLYQVTGKDEFLEYGLKVTDHILEKGSFERGLHWPIERFGFMQNSGAKASFTGYFYGAVGYGMLLLKAHNALARKKSLIRFVDDPFE